MDEGSVFALYDDKRRDPCSVDRYVAAKSAAP
jgi:hypothetical protein